MNPHVQRENAIADHGVTYVRPTSDFGSNQDCRRNCRDRTDSSCTPGRTGQVPKTEELLLGLADVVAAFQHATAPFEHMIAFRGTENSPGAGSVPRNDTYYNMSLQSHKSGVDTMIWAWAIARELRHTGAAAPFLSV